jgi:hypothetical protein
LDNEYDGPVLPGLLTPHSEWTRQDVGAGLQAEPHAAWIRSSGEFSERGGKSIGGRDIECEVVVSEAQVL